MKTEYELILNANQKYLDGLQSKLAVFKALPRDLIGLANCEAEELFDYVSRIEKDPFKVYEAIETAFHENFLEKVIFQKYGHLFDDDQEGKYNERFEKVLYEVRNEISLLKAQSAYELMYYKRLSILRQEEINQLKIDLDL